MAIWYKKKVKRAVKTNPKPSMKSIPDEWICNSIRSWT